MFAAEKSNEAATRGAMTHASPKLRRERPERPSRYLWFVTLSAVAAGAALAAAAAPEPPLHVPTMAYVGEDRYDDPGKAIVARYVTYERTLLQGRGGSGNCPTGGRCEPVSYMNTHNIYCTAAATTLWFAAAQNHPSWWLHTGAPDSPVLSAATRYGRCPDYDSGSGGTYYANFADAGDLAFWRGYLARKAAAAQQNQCFFLDDVPYHFYHYSGEIPDADALFAAEGREFDALAPACLWTNGLGPGGGFYGRGVITRGGAVRGAVSIEAYTRYSHAGNVEGVTFEDPLWSESDRRLHAENLPVTLNTISQLLAHTSLRIAVLDYSAAPDGASLDQVRRLHTAALWLVTGTSLLRIVSWLQPYIPAAQRRPLGIYPEQLVVPTLPLRPLGPWSPAPDSEGSGCRNDRAVSDGSTGGMADVLIACGRNRGDAAGAYVREYAACYDAGTPIGRCAAVVNLQHSTVSLDQRRLAEPYGYAMSWTGGPLRGVCPLDDGCNGELMLHARRLAQLITIPAEDALLLVE